MVVVMFVVLLCGNPTRGANKGGAYHMSCFASHGNRGYSIQTGHSPASCERAWASLEPYTDSGLSQKL